jgi:Kelch motif protein
MTSARANAMGTRLADGRVLVAGGDTGSGVTDSAEVFDPATGKWSPVAAMLVARGYHDGLLLDDGRALVFGGDGVYDKTKGAELWDPASDAWKATGPVVTTRFEPAFAKLRDGRVLVAGGWNGDELASAEIYDPRTNTWAKTADLNTPRGEASVMVTLDDGRPAKPGTLGFGELAKRFTLSRKGTFAVRVVCSAAGECTDTLVLNAGKTTLARTRFKLGKGKPATITLKLSKASLRRISRTGTKVTLGLTGRHVAVRTTLRKP